MTDEKKKKPEENEVSDEQLEDVAGGATAGAVQQDISLTKQVDKASTPLMDSVNEGNVIYPIVLDFGGTTDDED